MAGCCGATSVVTDFESLVPLMTYNIERNRSVICSEGGCVKASPLCWGAQSTDISDDIMVPDFLVLANCIYYESSLEPLRDTVLAVTSNGTAATVILACYEERTKSIEGLVSRWHDLILPYFSIEEVPSNLYDSRFKQDYVRLVIMTPLFHAK